MLAWAKYCDGPVEKSAVMEKMFWLPQQNILIPTKYLHYQKHIDNQSLANIILNYII